MDRRYKTPVVAWLKVTDYMHDWVQNELGGAAMIKEQRVVCILDLPGVRDIMKKETVNDSPADADISFGMSAAKYNRVDAGIRMDPLYTKKKYGLTDDALKLYIPIECPKMCMTEEGVLRPWSSETGFSREQSGLLLKVMRQEFWRAVAMFDSNFATSKHGERYTAKEMIEAFCAATHTSDVYLEAIRREWQRRIKRGCSAES